MSLTSGTTGGGYKQCIYCDVNTTLLCAKGACVGCHQGKMCHGHD